MRKFQSQRRWRKWLYSWPVILLLALFLTVVSRSAWRISRRGAVAEAERQAVTQKLAAVASRQERLAEDLELLATARGVESAIRFKFPVAKEGERVITVLAPTSPTTTADAAGAGFWQRLWQALFERD